MQIVCRSVQKRPCKLRWGGAGAVGEGTPPNERRYFDEFLPALFERTLVVNAPSSKRGFQWIFTGERASLTIEHDGPTKVLHMGITFYDSPGFVLLDPHKPGRNPQSEVKKAFFTLPDSQEPRALTVRLDQKQTLSVLADGSDGNGSPTTTRCSNGSIPPERCCMSPWIPSAMSPSCRFRPISKSREKSEQRTNSALRAHGSPVLNTASMETTTSLPLDRRVRLLLDSMTLREKVGQLNQRMFGWNAYTRKGEGIELTAAFHEEVARWGGMGALYGLFRADPWAGVTLDTGIRASQSARAANLIQRHIREHTRLGIPVLLSEECPHGHMALDGTLLPTGIGVAATWNPALYEKAMGHVASEIRSRGAHLGLVLNLDLSRDPRWGRTEECLGEDPFLAARYAAAAVFGLQGRSHEGLRSGTRVAAVSKTFTAHGAPEGGRNIGPAAIGERELREIHLPPAQAAVKAGTRSLMGCYNEIDGLPCHANGKLLRGILREEWGFTGFLMADGTALDRLAMQAGDLPGAAAMALKAGVDLSLWDDAFPKLEEAFDRGLVSMEQIDEAVANVLRVKFELGLFENPFTDEGAYLQSVGNEEIRAASLQIARESLTLLKNERNLLPLEARHRKIALIGPNADQLYNQLGDYTAPQPPATGLTVLEGLRAVAGDRAEISHARGCGIRATARDGFEEALKIAGESDVVVLVLGGSSTRNFDVRFDVNGAAITGENPSEMDCGEGLDVADLALGGVQEELAKAILELGKPVVLLLIAGRPHTMPELFERIPAILCAWYPGPFGGRAIAEALFGDIEPTGRLPLTWPRSAGQLPVFYNRKDTNRPIAYQNLPARAQFGFGHGLGYTDFEYGCLQLDKREITAAELRSGGRITVSVDVSNAGPRTGAEVVQLYIKDLEASITRRVMELKGFAKVSLTPGERQTVEISLGFEELAIWCADMILDVEPGRVLIMVGSSSENILLRDELRIHSASSSSSCACLGCGA